MSDDPRDASPSLGDAEKGAIQTLSLELKDHLELSEVAFNLIGRVQAAIPKLPINEVSQAYKVCLTLLVRISNDLRCSALLACHGYAVQTLSTVASMYEGTFTLAAIGDDGPLAQKWIEHSDPTQSFMPAKELTKNALTKLGVSDPSIAAAKQYLTYRQLCMAKHANPLLQMQHGHQLRGDTVVWQNGPSLSEPAIRATWFALEHAAGLASVAVGSFLTHHVPAVTAKRFASDVDLLGKRAVELRKGAVARWGDEDPFPGKWRR